MSADERFLRAQIAETYGTGYGSRRRSVAKQQRIMGLSRDSVLPRNPATSAQDVKRNATHRFEAGEQTFYAAVSPDAVDTLLNFSTDTVRVNVARRIQHGVRNAHREWPFEIGSLLVLTARGRAKDTIRVEVVGIDGAQVAGRTAVVLVLRGDTS